MWLPAFLEKPKQICISGEFVTTPEEETPRHCHKTSILCKARVSCLYSIFFINA